jgi:hypothetical protein
MSQKSKPRRVAIKPMRGFGDVDEFIRSVRAPDIVTWFALLEEGSALMPLGTKGRADWVIRTARAIAQERKRRGLGEVKA